MNPENMIRIGITGQLGFIGTHLYNYFGLKSDIIIRIPCYDEFFDDEGKLNDFVRQCDIIIHLAALNRHYDPQIIYDTNVNLIDKLIVAMEVTKSTPHVIFSSSTQEERDNMFGRSKREGRKRLLEWATRNKALFTGLIIPNVYGPFGKPFYNSVVATFCHQLTHGEKPVIEVDAAIKLIYIGELTEIIWDIILEEKAEHEFKVPHFAEKKVSEIYRVIGQFADQYLLHGIIPEINDCFEYNLFNTFMTYNAIQSFYPVQLKMNKDNRGSFVELMKTYRGGQFSFSTTKPSITRGNHYHTRKIERFAVIKGKAIIRLRRVGDKKILEFNLDGETPAYVDIPIWYTHNIINTGKDELFTVFWINEFFNADDPDTFYEEV